MGSESIDNNSKIDINYAYSIDYNNKQEFQAENEQQVTSIYTALDNEASTLYARPDVDGNNEVNEEDFKKGNFDKCISKMQSLADTLKNHISSLLDKHGNVKKKFEAIKEKYEHYISNLQSKARDLQNVMNIVRDKAKPNEYNYTEEEKRNVETYNTKFNNLETYVSDIITYGGTNPINELNKALADALALRQEIVQSPKNGRNEFVETKYKAYCKAKMTKLDALIRDLDNRIKDYQPAKDREDSADDTSYYVPSETDEEDLYEFEARMKAEGKLPQDDPEWVNLTFNEKQEKLKEDLKARVKNPHSDEFYEQLRKNYISELNKQRAFEKRTWGIK